MNTTAFVELSITKRGQQYFVMVIDNIETNEVGPFNTKRDAQAIYQQLVRNAQAMGRSLQ